MPGAVLHVSGERFDPNDVLPSLALLPYRVWRRGESVAPTGPSSKRIYESGGFSCVVSRADGLLAAEASDALAFLTEHRVALASLRDYAAVDDVRIDFGHYLRIDNALVTVQVDSLGPELLRLAGELGVGFEFSLYPAPAPASQDDVVDDSVTMNETEAPRLDT